VPKKKVSFLDLHGVLHEDADFVIEKFITDNFQKMPVKIITGYSDFFIDKIRF
jgi:DNA-nicking Smr family endonuclease